MSIDRSLKSKNSLVRHRNVLTRSERLEALEEEERWSKGDSVLALPKVVHRKAVVSKKEKAAAEEPIQAATTLGPEAAADQAEQSEQSKARETRA